jgi:hypothetical protein
MQLPQKGDMAASIRPQDRFVKQRVTLFPPVTPSRVCGPIHSDDEYFFVCTTRSATGYQVAPDSFSLLPARLRTNFFISRKNVDVLPLLSITCVGVEKDLRARRIFFIFRL